MATTTKKPVTNTTKETVSDKETVNSDVKMDSLESQLAEALKRIDALTTQVNTESNTPAVEKIDKEEYIPVISQCIGHLDLTTDGRGNGIPYRFPYFGYVMDIPYYDLSDIVRNNPSFVEQGKFYIAHEKAVKALRLKPVYDRLLNHEDMMNLFEKNPETIIELYKLAPDAQKEDIITLIMDRKQKGEYVDANILVQLGTLSGKQLIGRLSRTRDFSRELDSENS